MAVVALAVSIPYLGTYITRTMWTVNQMLDVQKRDEDASVCWLRSVGARVTVVYSCDVCRLGQTGL